MPLSPERVVPQLNDENVRTDRVAPRSRKRTESAIVSEVAATPNRQIFTDVREIRRFPIPRDLQVYGSVHSRITSGSSPG